MAAAEIRSAGTKRSVLEEIHTDALADARHDLDGSARAAGFKFADSYKTLKRIGSPRDTSEGAAYELEHENTRIEQFLKLIPPGQAVNDAAAGKVFKSTFLPREPADNGLVNGRPSGVLHRFRRNDTDNIPYEVSSCIVATRPAEGVVARTWHLHGVKLYDFLNSNSGGEGGTPLTLTIDAVNVSFFEGLTIDVREAGAPPTRTVNYVLTRAGLIDGAEKANKCVDTTDNYTVKVEKIYDRGQSTMLFPATDTDRIVNETLTEMESFFSLYNICIPPVKTVSGIRSATIDFTDEAIKRQLTSIKSAAEDKNPNALSKIGRQLNELMKWIAKGGAGSGISTIQYYMCVQRKRAGDWLQVLACLFPEVFGLPRDYRIKIATEDRICLLFALKMGIDVIFTVISHSNIGGVNNTEYCLITFYKQGPVLNVEAQLANAGRELLESCRNSPPSDSRPLLDYRARRDQYIEQRAAKEVELFAILEGIPAPAGQLDKNGAKAYIKRVLLAALRLCIFRILTPEFTRTDNEADTLQTIQAEGFVLTLANTEQYRAEIQQYRNQWFTLKRVIETKITKHPGRPQLALEDYFNDIFNVGTATANFNRKAAIIEKIDLNPRTFSEENLNENGTGIFGYLNTGLTAAQKYFLYTALTKLAPRLQAALVKNYSKVLNLAGVILLEDTRIAVAAAPAAAPPGAVAAAAEAAVAAGEVVANGDSTANILNAMFPTQGFIAAQPAPLAVFGGAKRGGAVGEYNEDITGTIGTVIADFFPEQVILALRGQAALQAYIIPEDAAFLVDISAPPQQPPQPNLEGGGGKNDYILTYVHNPLTTFFLTLININHDLSCTIDHEYSLCMLSSIIYKMIDHAVKVTKGMDIFQIYDYLYLLELFLLKGVEQYFPNTGINHFMAGVLEDYYGISRLYNYEGALKGLKTSDIKVFIHVKPLQLKNKEIMRENTVKMKTLMGFLTYIENEMAVAKEGSYRNSVSTNILTAPSLNVRTTRRNGNLMKRLSNYSKTNNAKSLLRRLKEEAEAVERQSSMLRNPNIWNTRSMVSAKGGRKTRRRRRR